jgi:hypothetical protein
MERASSRRLSASNISNAIARSARLVVETALARQAGAFDVLVVGNHIVLATIRSLATHFRLVGTLDILRRLLSLDARRAGAALSRRMQRSLMLPPGSALTHLLRVALPRGCTSLRHRALLSVVEKIRTAAGAVRERDSCIDARDDE